MKKKSKNFEIDLPNDLKKYSSNQDKNSKKDFSRVNLTSLLSSINKSQIVYLGDFHTFDQNGRNLARLLQILIKKNKKLAIGVEIVDESNQEKINFYLDNHLTELEFLQEIDYKESWHFPWNHYKVFFDLAKKHNLEIIALNSTGSLEKRDSTTSHLIADFVEKNPDTTLLILFGELHIVPNKLPKKVLKLLKNKVQHVIIHQNLDQVFWKIQENNEFVNLAHQNAQIVKFSDQEFSLQTSPPWIKFESMIYWFQNICEDPEFDIHEYVMETGKKILNGSVNDHFIFLCNKIISTLGLEKKISPEQVEDFNLYGHRKIEFVLTKIDAIPKKSISNFYRHLMLHGKSFKITGQNDYYCSSYSINRISFLAGIHVFEILVSNNGINSSQILLQGDQISKFLYLTHLNLIAYFSSKIVNPYRKCDLYQDIIDKINSPLIDESKKNGLRLGLKILNSKENLYRTLESKSIRNIHMASKSIGNFLGDILYDKFYKSSGNILKTLNENVFDNDFQSEQKFFSLLKKVLPTKKQKGYKKRIF